jgi:hypothetical protein
MLNTGEFRKPKVSKILLGFYFMAWYVLNVAYSIYVKRTLNVLPLPVTFAVIQLGAGAIWLLPQFLSGIRKVSCFSCQLFSMVNNNVRSLT